MHWFLAETWKTLTKYICAYKLSFCYFHHDEIFLLHESFLLHENGCWNGKPQIWSQKSNTPKKPLTQVHLATLLSYVFLVIVLLLLSDVIFGFKY